MIPIKDDNYLERVPYITFILIGLNVIIFLYQLFAGKEGAMFTYKFALVPRNIFHSQGTPPFLTLISSMFLHGGPAHLIGNMLFLGIFGDDIEDALGHFRYLFFYIVCGVIAALTHALIHHASGVPMLGASGAISGILGAYLLLYPGAKILTIVPIFFFLRFIWIKASFFLIVWFIFQLIYTASPQYQGIAFLAHIGGFLAGLGIIGLFKNYRGRKRKYEILWP
ncbi:MAG: rhomboid family intramembrane serine protease [Candidatus Omnitrophica bacterium]|nr:rhomboid family intramembrane serine protease [Candidatus Omnitrophota bacterium]